jgi:hypothetical protein
MLGRIQGAFSGAEFISQLHIPHSSAEHCGGAFPVGPTQRRSSFRRWGPTIQPVPSNTNMACGDGAKTHLALLGNIDAKAKEQASYTFGWYSN